MDNLFENKWFVRIISLIFAITLYLFVTVDTDTAENDSRIIPGSADEVHILDDVPLDIKINADEYVVSGVPEFVSVSLEGKTSVLAPTVRQRNFNVFVDLRDLEEGEHIVDVEYENISNELTVYIEPKTITVNIEKRATQEFAVDVDLINLDQLPVGYELGEPEVSPETVTIVSSEEIIEQIAMVKVFVDVTDLRESIRSREVPVSVYDVQGNDLSVRVEPESVAVSILVERPSKTVPLQVETTGELPEGLALDEITAQEELEIFGRRDILSEIDEISTVEIDLSEIEESGQYEIELDFPEDVTANDETVEVTIDIIEERVFEEVDIDLTGENDFNITFIQPDDSKVNVLAIGHDLFIRELDEADIAAAIDIGNLDEGEHEIPLTVTGPNEATFEPEFEEITVLVE